MGVNLTKLRRTDQPLWTAASAVYPWDPDAPSRYTIMDKQRTETLQLYRRDGDHLHLPRALCPVGLEDRREAGAPALFKSSVKPRNDEQARVILEAGDLLDNGESFQLRAPTGFGKTVIGADLIADVGRKTLVVVPKEDLIDAWVEALREFLGLMPSDIGLVQGDTVRTGCPVVIGMLKSLAIPDRYPAHLWRSFGLVIWDEVHKVPAPTFAHTADLFPALLRLGLSATPHRWDGKEIIMGAHIGPERVSTDAADLDFVVARYQSPWRCPRRDGEEIPHSAGECGHIINMVVRHAARNELIARMVIGGYRKGRRMVIFSDRKNQLEILRAAAIRDGAREDDTVMYVSGLSKKRREEARATQLIFATYGMMDTGTNVPALDSCILASPRANADQIIGRIRRPKEGKPKPVVVDIVDDSSSVFRNYGRGRMAFYKREKAAVTDHW